MQLCPWTPKALSPSRAFLQCLSCSYNVLCPVATSPAGEAGSELMFPAGVQGTAPSTSYPLLQACPHPGAANCFQAPLPAGPWPTKAQVEKEWEEWDGNAETNTPSQSRLPPYHCPTLPQRRDTCRPAGQPLAWF